MTQQKKIADKNGQLLEVGDRVTLGDDVEHVFKITCIDEDDVYVSPLSRSVWSVFGSARPPGATAASP